MSESVVERLYRLVNAHPGRVRVMIVSNRFWAEIHKLLIEQADDFGSALSVPNRGALLCGYIKVLSEAHVRALPEYAHLQRHLPREDST